ncbi:hypothetical protein F3Y22_tig00110160pilonHSYRG00564 [Hibiscus syriacus]|uniref:RNase H type-1 domain-containing protein n=1 Tax=Hibiscus syriacus TaxID=106335 RepID=A0A6A3BFF3_HIBSY|nr:hypothetical protein F3Y22_tig00110160pilonHSYRG00564 [Hibiscus syriacus]
MARRASSNQHEGAGQVYAKGWYKFKSDGARHTSLEITSCGGIIRDDDGKWIVDYGKSISSCSVLDAELWRILEGLKLAWDLQPRAVIVKMDNSEAIAVLEEGNRWGSSSSVPHILDGKAEFEGNLQSYIWKMQHIRRWNN